MVYPLRVPHPRRPRRVNNLFYQTPSVRMALVGHFSTVRRTATFFQGWNGLALDACPKQPNQNLRLQSLKYP
jgi:hypothetical protein